MSNKWWMEGVGYQIYLKTFYDSDNDGIGDIQGVIQKLDYIKDLGIDFIWLSPFNTSPMDDNGYDISDFYDVNKLFGSLNDLKQLIETAHKLDIKIVMDLVLNHTSDEHPWFIESRRNKTNKYRDYYIWHKGTSGGFPNNWGSFFGGSAWKLDNTTNEYYMKIFSDKMPDLNWENENMRNELYSMINWWIDFGMDGFRVDAISHIDRDRSFENSKLANGKTVVLDTSKFSNLPKVHIYLKDMSKNVFKKRGVMTVGEVGGEPTSHDVLSYAGYESQELDIVFTFDHMWCFDSDSHNTNLLGMKKVFKRYQNGLFDKGWNTLYWENHDQIRHLSKYGDTEKYHKESAKMLCLALYFMWGTPFVYNGQEIGMYNYPFEKIENFNDVSIHTRYELLKKQGADLDEFIAQQAFETRDNARTAMQWDNTKYAGFTKRKNDMLINPNYTKINVLQQQKDKNSILNFHKKVFKIRKSELYKNILIYGKFKMLFEEHENVLSYVRTYKNKSIIVVANFFEKQAVIELSDIDTDKLIISNYTNICKHSEGLILRPYEAMAFELENI